MKLTIIIGILLFFSAGFCGEIKKEFEVKPGGVLEIDIKTGGDIRVKGWDKNTAVITVYHKGDKLDEDVWLDINKINNGVSVILQADGNSNQKIRIEASVPKVYDVNLLTMGGDIFLNNLEGRLEGETMGGDLNLSALKGKVKISTMGGDIQLRDSDVDGKVSTMGGEVELEDVIGDVDGSSMGGNIVYKNVKRRNGKSTGKQVHISTMGGEIEVDEAMSGADVSTMGGDIVVRKAKEYVKASTMGGDVEIRDIDGMVKASTMGGDVEVRMTGDPAEGRRDVDISSMGGDIVLTLPAGISAQFDVKITYTRNSRQNYKIDSDFPLKITEDKDWKFGKGDPRKIIKGDGKTGDGEHTVRINTTNGNIIINKE